MGNAPNVVRVATDRPVYTGGDTITGYIHLSVTVPFNSNGIFLRTKGVEKVSWEEHRTRTVGSGDNQRTEHYTEYVNRKNEFFRIEHLLYQFPGGIVPPGQYSFPFSYYLPPGLPGSFFDNSLPKHGMAVRFYKVKALAHVQGFLKSNIKHTQPFTVQETYNQQVFSQQLEETKNINTCCCIKKGTAFMRVRMDKNYYVPGETAQLICECSNQSSIELTNMKVKFFRELVLHAGGHTLQHRPDLNVLTCPGIESFGEFVGENARYVSLPLASNLMGGGIMPSSESPLIQNRYFVQVKMAVPWGSDFRLTLPVAIGQVPVQTWQPLMNEQPQNWTPQVFAPVVVPTPIAPVMPTQMPSAPMMNLAGPPPGAHDLKTPLLADGSGPNYSQPPPSSNYNYAPGNYGAPPPNYNAPPPAAFGAPPSNYSAPPETYHPQ